MKMFIAARRVRNSGIGLQLRSTARNFAVIGPMRVVLAQSRRSARRAKSVASRGGSTEEIVEAVQQRLDKNPDAMRTRRETVEHPFGTMKMRMGATHFLTKTLPKVATEMALCVLTYNLTRVLNIVGIKPLMTAIQA